MVETNNTANATINFAATGDIESLVPAITALRDALIESGSSVQNVDKMFTKMLDNIRVTKTEVDGLTDGTQKLTAAQKQRADAAREILGDDKHTALAVADIKNYKALAIEIQAVATAIRNLPGERVASGAMTSQLTEGLTARVNSILKQLGLIQQAESRMRAIESQMSGMYFRYANVGDATSGGAYRQTQAIGELQRSPGGVQALGAEYEKLTQIIQLADTAVDTINQSFMNTAAEKQKAAELKALGKEIDAVIAKVHKEKLPGEIDPNLTAQKTADDIALQKVLTANEQANNAKRIANAIATEKQITAAQTAEKQKQLTVEQQAQKNRLAAILNTEQHARDAFARTGTAFMILYSSQKLVRDATSAFMTLNQSLTQTQAILQSSEYDYQKSADHIKLLGDYVDKISMDIPIAANDIAKAFDTIFQATEATTKQAAEWVELAGKMSVGTGQKLETLVPILMAVKNAYKTNTDELTHYSDVLVRAWKDGVFTFEEAHTGLSRLIQSGKIANITFEELMALFVGITKEGGSAQRNITMLVNVLNNLQSPKQQKRMGEGGIDISQSIIGQLQQIKAMTEKDPQIISKIFTDMRTRSGVQLLVSELDTVKVELQALIDTSGDVQDVFTVAMEAAANKTNLFRNRIAVLQRDVGETLVNAFLPVIDILGQWALAAEKSSGAARLILDAIKGLLIPLGLLFTGLLLTRAQMMLFNMTLAPGVSGVYSMGVALLQMGKMLVGVVTAETALIKTEADFIVVQNAQTAALAAGNEELARKYGLEMQNYRMMQKNIPISGAVNIVTLGIVAALAAWYVNQGYLNAKIQEFTRLAEEAAEKARELQDEIQAIVQYQRETEDLQLGADVSQLNVTAEHIKKVIAEYKDMQIRLDLLQPDQEKFNENVIEARRRLVDMIKALVDVPGVLRVTQSELEALTTDLDLTNFQSKNATEQIDLLDAAFQALSTAHARNEIDLLNATLDDMIEKQRAAYYADLLRRANWTKWVGVEFIDPTGMIEESRTHWISTQMTVWDEKMAAAKTATLDKVGQLTSKDEYGGEFAPPSKSDPIVDKLEQMFEQIQARRSQLGQTHKINEGLLSAGFITPEEQEKRYLEDDLKYAEDMIRLQVEFNTLAAELNKIGTSQYKEMEDIIAEMLTDAKIRGRLAKEDLEVERLWLEYLKMDQDIHREGFAAESEMIEKRRKDREERKRETGFAASRERWQSEWDMQHPFATKEQQLAHLMGLDTHLFEAAAAGDEVSMSELAANRKSQLELQHGIEADRLAAERQTRVRGITMWASPYTRTHAEQSAKMSELQGLKSAAESTEQWDLATDYQSQIEDLMDEIRRSTGTLTNVFRSAFLSAIDQMAQSIATTGKVDMGQLLATFGGGIAEQVRNKVSAWAADNIAKAAFNSAGGSAEGAVLGTGEGFASALLGGLGGAAVSIGFGLLANAFGAKTHVNQLDAVPVRVINFADFMRLFTLPQSAYFAPMGVHSILQYNTFSTATAPGIERELSRAISPNRLYREASLVGVW